MKYLNTIRTTSYVASFKAHMEKTYSLIRPYCLTHNGAYRALKNDYPELNTAGLMICHVEHASIQSR
jgi:hypothetical protein